MEQAPKFKGINDQEDLETTPNIDQVADRENPAANDSTYGASPAEDNLSDPSTWKVEHPDEGESKQLEGDPNDPATWKVESAEERTPDQTHSAEAKTSFAAASQEHIHSDEVAVYAKFQETFNIDPETLSQIEGFAELSRDQKAFVLHQLKQTSLNYVDEESIRQSQSREAAIATENGLSIGAGKWKISLKRAAKSFLYSLTKGYQMARDRKEITNEIFAGEGDLDTIQTITSLTNTLRNTNTLDVREKSTPDGQTRFMVDYTKAAGFESEPGPNEQAIIEEFNEAADVINQLPLNPEDGSVAELEAHEQATERYESARAHLIALREANGQSGADIDRVASELDMAIFQNRFLNDKPDVEAALAQIKDESVWLQTVKRIVSTKGASGSAPVLAAGGFGVRATAGATLGSFGIAASVVAAPAIGGVLGWYRGKLTAEEKMSENDRLARAGGKKESVPGTLNNLDDATSLTQKLQFKIQELTSKTGLDLEKVQADLELLEGRIRAASGTHNHEEVKMLEKEKSQLLQPIVSLNARIKYTEKKLTEDLVNYGESYEQRANRLTLLQTMGTAATMCAAFHEISPALNGSSDESEGNETKSKPLTALLTRVNRVVDTHSEQNKTIRGEHVKTQARLGMYMGAGFGLFGAATAHAAEVAAAAEIADVDAATTASDPGDAIVQPMRATPDMVEPTFTEESSEAIHERLENLSEEERAALGITEDATWPTTDLGEPTISSNSQHGQMLDEQSGILTDPTAADAETFAEETPETPPPAETLVGPGPQADALYRQNFEAVEQSIQSLVQEVNKTPGYDVQPGDNIWNIIEKKLEAHELFRGLEEGQRLHLIDELKDRVAKMSTEELREFGIASGDPNLIHPGETLDFSRIMNSESVTDATANAENLSVKEISSIEAAANNPTSQTPSSVEVSNEGATFADLGEPTIAADSEQGRMLAAQRGDFLHSMAAEQTAEFVAESVINEDIHKLYGSNGLLGSGLLGTDGTKSVDWLDIKDRTVGAVLEKNQFPLTDQWGDEVTQLGYDSPGAVTKMQHYLRGIMQASNVAPNPQESVQAYLERAITAMASRG